MSKKRNKGRQKKSNHTHLRVTYQRVDNQTGEVVEKIPDVPNQQKKELIQRIRDQHSDWHKPGAPEKSEQKEIPNNVFHFKDKKEKQKTQEAKGNAAPAVDHAADKRKEHDSSWQRRMQFKAKNSKLTCQREEQLSTDKMKERRRPIGLAGEQNLRRREFNQRHSTGILGHRRSENEQRLAEELTRRNIQLARVQKGVEPVSGLRYPDGYDMDHGGYDPGPRTPSGKPISMFLEGGKYPPKKQNVVQTTSTAANDSEHVSNLYTQLNAALKQVPVNSWPGWVCNMTQVIDDKVVIDKQKIDDLSMGQEYQLSRALTDWLLQQNSELHDDYGRVVDENKMMWWELSLFKEEEKSPSPANERHAYIKVYELKAELHRLKCQLDNQRELVNQPKDRQPSTLDELTEQRDYHSVKRAQIDQRVRNMRQHMLHERVALKRIQRRVYYNFHVKPVVDEHRRFVQKRKAAVSKLRSGAVGWHNKLYDTELFRHWGWKQSRRYDPDHPNSVVWTTFSDKLEPSEYLLRCSRKRHKRQQLLQAKAFGPVVDAIGRCVRDYDRKQVEYLANNTLDGKILATTVRGWNRVADTLNMEINPFELKRQKKREARRLRRQQTKAFGRLANIIGQSVRHYDAEQARLEREQQEQHAQEERQQKEAARRAFMSAH